MNKVFIIVVVLTLAGCAQMSAYLPTAISVGKMAYCAAKTEEERQSIRERYSLPHIVYCPTDTRSE